MNTQGSITPAPVARLRSQRGAASAEYAAVTAAGCGLAAVLIKLLSGGFGQELLGTVFEFFMRMIGLG